MRGIRLFSARNLSEARRGRVCEYAKGAWGDYHGGESLKSFYFRYRVHKVIKREVPMNSEEIKFIKFMSQRTSSFELTRAGAYAESEVSNILYISHLKFK